MTNKQPIKLNEARILMYLNNARVKIRYIRAIAAKLDISYPYAIHTLSCMTAKGWIKREKMPQKTYFHIARAAPLREAKALFKREKLVQKRLK